MSIIFIANDVPKKVGRRSTWPAKNSRLRKFSTGESRQARSSEAAERKVKFGGIHPRRLKQPYLAAWLAEAYIGGRCERAPRFVSSTVRKVRVHPWPPKGHVTIHVPRSGAQMH